MINAEFYKEKLLEFAEDNKEIALNNNGDIVHCGNDINCNQCKWNYPKTSTCECEKIKWLLTEHKEYPKLTRFEKEFLKRIFIDYCQITRDPGGELFAYTDGHVTKGKCGWNISNGGEAHYLCTLCDDFSFIKWTDKEPWNIQELLENCEVEE